MSWEAIASLLGGPMVLGTSIGGELDLALTVERGLPSASLDRVVREFDPVLSVQAIYSVVGSEHTLRRKRRRRERLSPAESDRLARLARLAVRAQESLGSTEIALRWLVTPNGAMEERPPMELLRTDVGASLVEDVLERIEYGVLS